MTTKFRKFVPAGAGMTKATIFELLKDAVDCENENAMDNPDDEDFKIRDLTFTAKHISNIDAQTFVNEEDLLREDYVDEDEGDFVDERCELALRLVDKMLGG